MALHEAQIHETSPSPVPPYPIFQSSLAEAGNPVDDAAGPTSNTPTVLWIDDRVDDATVRLLRLEGLRVECATTGSSGLTRARSRRYHAYIIDLQLPDMYGLTVLDRLVAAGSHTPVLILTGCYTEPESEKLARQLGARDFRCKPIAAGELACRPLGAAGNPRISRLFRRWTGTSLAALSARNVLIESRWLCDRPANGFQKCPLLSAD